MKDLSILDCYDLDKNKIIILKSLKDIINSYLKDGKSLQDNIDLLDNDIFYYFNFLKSNNKIPKEINIEYSISYLKVSKKFMIIFSEDLSLFFDGLLGLSF